MTVLLECITLGILYAYVMAEINLIYLPTVFLGIPTVCGKAFCHSCLTVLFVCIIYNNDICKLSNELSRDVLVGGSPVNYFGLEDEALQCGDFISSHSEF